MSSRRRLEGLARRLSALEPQQVVIMVRQAEGDFLEHGTGKRYTEEQLQLLQHQHGRLTIIKWLHGAELWEAILGMYEQS